MAEWLEQASHWHEIYCHDLEVISLSPSWVELYVLSTSFQVLLEPKMVSDV